MNSNVVQEVFPIGKWKGLIETAVPIALGWIEKIAGFLYGRYEKFKNKQDIIDKLTIAVDYDAAEDFIDEYEIKPDYAKLIRKVATWRRKTRWIFDIIEDETYTEESIEIFKSMINDLLEIKTDLPFEEADIKLKVTTIKENETIKIINENYLIALLYRFVAICYAQLAYELSDKKGKMIHYDTILKSKYKKYKKITFMASLSEELFIAYKNTFSFYDKAKAIHTNYMDASKYFEETYEMIDKVKRRIEVKGVKNQNIHMNMSLEHLKGLNKAFKAEAKYWLYNKSFDVYPYMKTLCTVLTDNIAKETLRETMGWNQEQLEKELNRIRQVSFNYKDIQDSFYKIKNLLSEAVKLLEVEHEKKPFLERQDDVNQIISSFD